MAYFTWRETGLTSEGQRITHPDPAVFEAYGFVSEEPPERQLTLLQDSETSR
jgi:hypothetical protein